LDYLKEFVNLPEHIYDELNQYAGGAVVGNDKNLESIVEEMVSHAVRYAIDKIDPEWQNPKDMRELQRDPYDINEYEDEEDFYGDDEDDEMEESSHDKTYDPITKKWYQ